MGQDLREAKGDDREEVEEREWRVGFDRGNTQTAMFCLKGKPVCVWIGLGVELDFLRQRKVKLHLFHAASSRLSSKVIPPFLETLRSSSFVPRVFCLNHSGSLTLILLFSACCFDPSSLGFKETVIICSLMLQSTSLSGEWCFSCGSVEVTAAEAGPLKPCVGSYLMDQLEMKSQLSAFSFVQNDIFHFCKFGNNTAVFIRVWGHLTLFRCWVSHLNVPELKLYLRNDFLSCETFLFFFSCWMKLLWFGKWTQTDVVCLQERGTSSFSCHKVYNVFRCLFSAWKHLTHWPKYSARYILSSDWNMHITERTLSRLVLWLEEPPPLSSVQTHFSSVPCFHHQNRAFLQSLIWACEPDRDRIYYIRVFFWMLRLSEEMFGQIIGDPDAAKIVFVFLTGSRF